MGGLTRSEVEQFTAEFLARRLTGIEAQSYSEN